MKSDIKRFKRSDPPVLQSLLAKFGSDDYIEPKQEDSTGVLSAITVSVISCKEEEGD